MLALTSNTDPMIAVGPSAPIDTTTADALARRAAALTKVKLERHDNALSPAHAEAIDRVMRLTTQLATGDLTGRHAVPLDCGLGKTQSIVHWCAAVVDLDLPLSVLVCASRIDELSGIHRELLAAGIPEADIGIVHSKPSDPTSVKPTTDNANRRIMLATHERVKGGSLPLDLTHYRGRKRDLVVWDESLMVSSARSIELGDLIPDILWLQARVQTVGLASTDLDAAVAYLTKCLRLIEVERQRQSRRRGQRPNVLTMPRITGETLAAFKDALPVDDRVASIRDFLDMALEPLRIVAVNQGGGILKYDLAIPSWMDRVIVLDASAPIRELVKADDGILIDPWFTGTNLKRYDHLTIKWLRMPGGRDAMTKAFERPPEDRELSRMIARLAAGIPADEGVLIVTFKPRGRLDMAAVLKADLKAMRIDVEATLPDGSARFSWTTFGRLTASNAWVGCRHIIFVGALYRREVQLAASLIGQRDDLVSEVSRADVLTVQHSEIAHELYQGINRTACRRTINGQADRSTAYVILKDRAPLDIIAARMPGARIEGWDVEDERAATLTTKARKAITAYLAALPPEATKVSLKKLKADLGLVDLHNKTFQTARDAALKATGWRLAGLSVVRSCHPSI